MTDSSFQEQSNTREELADFKHLFERITPLPQVTVQTKEVVPSYVIGGYIGQNVEITWEEAEPFNGGGIYVKFADHFDNRGFPTGKNRRFITSYVETNEGSIWPPQRNPSEGIAAALSLVATLNQVASETKTGLLHVDEANSYSEPLLRKLMDLGVYHYCDRKGKQTYRPLTLEKGILFACQYPVAGIKPLLDKYVLKDAVVQIKELGDL